MHSHKIFTAVCLLLSIVLKAQRDNQHIISVAGELKHIYDISLLPAYRTNTIEAQISTYDTTGGNDDGFNGTYSFIRRNADSSLVIFDEKGPGVINHIHTPTPTGDTLDFFIDDMSRPAFSINYMDLFSGKVFPFVSPLCGSQLGGYYCYFPIPYQKELRIICRGKRLQFHDIQFRTFPQGTTVKNFSFGITNEEKELLKNIQKLWSSHENKPGDFITGDEQVLSVTKTIQLKEGEATSLFNTKTGGRIIGITLQENEADKKIYKQVDLKINWDAESTPAVYCPLADFFGYAFGKPSMQSLLLGYKNGKHYCYFPMPFDKEANMQLLNRNTDKDVTIKATIFYTSRKRDAATEGRFYTSWNTNIHDAGSAAHVFLDTKAKGHYVGSVLQASGLHAGVTTFFEGDDSTAVDGKMVIHGTGSEDYFNGGWYALLDRWDSKFSLPVHGALDYSAIYSRTGGYRFYLGDKISFNKTIFQSIEHGPEHNNVAAHYTSLALFYADKAPANFLQPTNERCNIFMPDTLLLYPQLLKFSSRGDVSMSGLWIGADVVIKANDESLLTFFTDDIEPGTYKLFASFSKAPDGCSFSLWHRQTQLSNWVETYSNTKEEINAQYLCDVDLSDNNHSLSLHFKTDEHKSTLLLKGFILVKVKQ
ncbi:MAG TPA: glycoside hydrolase family 172 protein [Chitinophagaceae bacterium]|nr:glycoside hydrolase family 172 protein [Chitinophagaceae bacterium]